MAIICAMEIRCEFFQYKKAFYMTLLLNYNEHWLESDCLCPGIKVSVIGGTCLLCVIMFSELKKSIDFFLIPFSFSLKRPVMQRMTPVVSIYSQS